MTRGECQALIDALLDDAITESEFARLQDCLQEDSVMRALYYERLRLHTSLELIGEEMPSAVATATTKSRWIPSGEWIQTAARLAALGTLLAAGAGLTWWKLRPPAAQTPDFPGTLASEASEPAAKGFAVLTEQSQAVWERSRPFSKGELIPAGTLHLLSGTVQLDLFSGVTLIAESDAEFEILSAMEMRVVRGKIRAQVPPPSQGFRIHTTQGQLVDLGTEFALDVGPDHADVHVLDGEVEWHPLDQADHRLLQKGQAVRWSRDQGSGVPLPFPQVTSSISSLEASLARQRSDRRRAWEAHGTSHASDARVLAYFPMNEPGPWHRSLRDSGPLGLEGTIVRTQRVADRWGQADSALDFSPTGSRVRLQIPGTHQALTLYCWARIDSLDRWYNSLFLTDGHELHEPHWQIMNDGRLFFSVKAHDRRGPNNPDKHICHSPPFWSASLSGRWIQLATTFDSERAEVAHYLNGEILNRESVPEPMLVRAVKIGAASIGNWSEPKRHDPDFAIRNLNGAIDEFLLFDTALSPAEIATLYHSGKP